MSDAKQKSPKGVQLQIKVDEDVAQGIYANMAMVHHTDAEFTIDFVYVQPQAPQAKVRSRVVTSPRHLKRLISALQDNLNKYEAKFGEVDMAAAPPPVASPFKH
ncbi:MAG: DUF3467 domain-containing protein [Deltaproteobacteria bacterium]|nr:DUF3467 domain-containing protein [Deltaproteobacteria bacterium]